MISHPDAIVPWIHYGVFLDCSVGVSFKYLIYAIHCVFATIFCKLLFVSKELYIYIYIFFFLPKHLPNKTSNDMGVKLIAQTHRQIHKSPRGRRRRLGRWAMEGFGTCEKPCCNDLGTGEGIFKG